ncbi:MAG: cation:proton antiporter [Rhodocyclaceae bacterium]|nr:cation:proton antiporter [Rhodocyclaceae bacterium]
MYSFLPPWPPAANGFILFGLLIIGGLVGGRLAQRTGVLPRITGFIFMGVMLGPGVSGVISPGMLENAQVFVDVALGLILFQMGRLLDVELVWRERALVLASSLESALSFVAVFAVLLNLGFPAVHAGLAAAIGISSSPAIVLLVVKELGARGPITERTLVLVALNNAISFLAFLALLPAVHRAHNESWGPTLLGPLYVLIVSVVIALVLAWGLIRLARQLPRDERTQFALLLGTIIGAVGLAKMLGGSPLLTLLALGILVHNMDLEDVLLPVDFGMGAELFFVILFVVAGARMHLEDVLLAGIPALAFVLARFVGKYLGLLALRGAGFDAHDAGLIGLNLMPMAGMAIGLTQMLTERYPVFIGTFSAIVFAAIAILETIGPIATEYALKRSGEVADGAQVKH